MKNERLTSQYVVHISKRLISLQKPLCRKGMMGLTSASLRELKTLSVNNVHGDIL